MNTTKQIQIIIARADLVIIRAAQVLAVVVLAALLLALVWCVRTYIESRYDPYLIDYDRPGVDITSEGPEDDTTDAWFGTGGEESAEYHT